MAAPPVLVVGAHTVRSLAPRTDADEGPVHLRHPIGVVGRRGRHLRDEEGDLRKDHGIHARTKEDAEADEDDLDAVGRANVVTHDGHQDRVEVEGVLLVHERVEPRCVVVVAPSPLASRAARQQVPLAAQPVRDHREDRDEKHDLGHASDALEQAEHQIDHTAHSKDLDQLEQLESAELLPGGARQVERRLARAHVDRHLRNRRRRGIELATVDNLVEREERDFPRD